MKDITARNFAFKCECGEIHAVEIPTCSFDKIHVYECKNGTVLCWTKGIGKRNDASEDYHFEIHERREPAPHPTNLQEELIAFIARTGFGGDLNRRDYLTKWWAWPIRAAQRWAFKQWRKNCKLYGYRPFAENNDITRRFR